MTHSHTHLADMLDLDAEVLSDYHHEVITWAGSQAPGRPHILDLGAGSGAGSLALARHLPDATVTAVDVDEDMLTHLRHKAGHAGVGDRIRTVRADLDEPFPPLEPVDLAWASASLHHLANPARALERVFAAVRPGGVFVVTELDSFPRFLPDGPDGDLEDRCQAESAKMRTEHGMHMDEDWSARLAQAGFTVEAERRFDIVLSSPLPPAAGRYAQVTFQRLRHGLEGRLSPGDLTAIERLAATVADRDDLTIRTVRTVWLARRPA